MFIELDRNSRIPIKKQLYDAITTRILKGELVAGERLPSTRELADRLGIARNTVIEIYEQLAAEAYLEAHHGKGTFVSAGYDRTAVNDVIPAVEKAASAKRRDRGDLIDFESGVPDLKAFPAKAWIRAVKDSFEAAGDARLGYGSAMGYMPLRESLSKYLARYKGIHCSPEQIVIVNGTADAMILCAMLFRKTSGELLIESAVVSFVPDIFRTFGYKLIPLEIDRYGLCTGSLPDVENGLIFCSPSHQFPLGGTLSIERRAQLTGYAKKHRHYIIEDDYDSEFIYTGAQVNSLYQLAPGNVIHVGTFSKTLAPFLRIGYMVLPQELVPKAREMQSRLYRRANIQIQMALERLLEQGIYVRHVAAMRKRYKKKIQSMINALNEEFGDIIQIYGANSGLHVAVVFPVPLFGEDSRKIFRKHKVSVDLLADYTIDRMKTCDTLVLGFGNLDQDLIPEGIRRLKAAVSEIEARKRASAGN